MFTLGDRGGDGLAVSVGLCESVLGGRDGGVRPNESAAERMQALGVMGHGLAEVTVAVEFRFVSPEDGCVD